MQDEEQFAVQLEDDPLAQAMKRFDPDDTWERVPDPDQDPANATAEADGAP